MTEEELLKEISKTLNKTKAGLLAELAGKSKEYVDQVIRLTFYPKKEIAFRAAWILESIYFLNPGNFREYSDSFLSAYAKQKNLSCKRHFTKIMMDITSPKNEIYHAAINAGFDFEAITETTFEWLIDPKTPVAVQVNCLDILYNLSFSYDWIKDELKAQTEFFLKNGSAAMQSRGKRILGKLK